MLFRVKIKKFIQNKKDLFFLFLSAILTINSLYFLSSQGELFPFFHSSFDRNFFYFIYFSVLAIGIGTVFFNSHDDEKITWNQIASKILIMYFPTEVIFVYGLQQTSGLVPYVGLASAIYMVLLVAFIIKKGLQGEQSERATISEKNTYGKIIASGTIILIMGLNLAFGTYHLGKIAVVDEPLWTFDRIPNFWEKIGNLDWYKSRVSDKPGLTTAFVAGAGLFYENNPKSYKKVSSELKPAGVEKFNFAFRLPLLLFTVVLLPFLYWLMRKILDRQSALLALIFIGLSPILIGNSRIINPDGFLWILSFMSLVSFWGYLAKNSKKLLMISAFLLALALLTKYTANILFIFFFCLIFLEYAINRAKYSTESFLGYIKQKLADFGLLSFLSLAFFYVLYPAVWEKPDRVLLGTILSQPFEPILPYFFGIILFTLLDTFILKGFFFARIINFFIRFRKGSATAIALVFIFSVTAVFLNIYGGMHYLNFEEILSSPKTSYRDAGFFGMYLTNFYPLIFGISPLALISLLIFLSMQIFSKNPFTTKNSQLVLSSIIFILFYYAGSTYSHVASTIRYQIIAYPTILFASGLALASLIQNAATAKWMLQKKLANISYPITSSIVIALLGLSLYSTAPSYMSYASGLLPQKYFIDVKDMGEGSYEAAMYLNSLPDPKNLAIWTDKKGVCSFFKGRCFTAIDSTFFRTTELDYFVASSGRKNRTNNMTSSKASMIVDFKKVYETQDLDYKIELDERPGNFVKIIKAEKAYE